MYWSRFNTIESRIKGEVPSSLSFLETYSRTYPVTDSHGQWVVVNTSLPTNKTRVHLDSFIHTPYHSQTGRP